ncbi:hypothetical protein [Nitrosospira sp. NpAV]|uniref:hypothetical protein n=1 Tax=Nitrosospira sp. NpAV TaxID=58133 RepID=UPI0005A2424C|nr:hypothetical protein [Nitrosospira sp. NpAV]KIO50268.1 hypothetical protein SQ11_00755 [Nitrosospira sp. NpAV]
MYPLVDSPVKDITFGDATQLTLDNYYDVLKLHVGTLQKEEYLQLKVAADTLDISSKGVPDGGYKWFSYYNMLRRSDRAISPSPVMGTVQTAVADLSQVYGNFLHLLRQYVVKKVLTPEEQLLLADLDKTLEMIRRQMREFAIQDRADWKDYAEAMGYEIGDMSAYVQWSNVYGHLRDIEEKMREQQTVTFDKKTILDRQYPEPADREVVDAEFNFDNPSMRLRYPIFPDYEYPNGEQFNLTYLALLPLGSTALFDDRRVLTWNMTLETIKTNPAGAFTGSFNKATQASKSITTDWGGSGNVSYGFISASASASEHKEISEDFKKGLKISIGSKAAFSVGIQYPAWFKPTLFTHKRVLENIRDFEEFFGAKGTLLYYPTQLIIVRGFAVEFESSQAWKYDFVKKFSASAGGGFNAFGIGFGGKASYSSHEEEHKVDQSGTKLTISDGEGTLRFVGYALKKNTVFVDEVKKDMAKSLGQAVIDEQDQ